MFIFLFFLLGGGQSEGEWGGRGLGKKMEKEKKEGGG